MYKKIQNNSTIQNNTNHVHKSNHINRTNITDTNNTNSSSDILTKQLVGRIYAETDISKFRYDMLNYEQDLQKLLKQPYYVTINFCGINSLLVFTKFHDKFYSFTIDRQSLSYNFSKVDFSKTKINLVNIGLDDKIYNGTIFEGILIKRRDMDDLYVISDVYKFCGKDVSKDKLNMKLFNIVEYFKSNYDKNLTSNNIELEVNRIFELKKFDYFYKEVLPKTKTLKYRGICFYPEISDTKLVYMINTDGNTNTSNIISKPLIKSQLNNKISEKSSEKATEKFIDKNINIKSSDTKQITYINTTDEIVEAVLEMKITDNPDVYKLYAVQKQIVDKRTVFKKIFMGIAHIKGIEMSHKFKKIFLDKKSSLMTCKFNNDNSKWEPIDVNLNIKIPTSIEEIESKLAIMEDSSSEDD